MMGRTSRVLALLGVALWLVWSGEALAAARVALVVGNGEYAPEIGKLKNPTSDAQLMADTLKGLGFEVALVTDADQKAMKRAIREFGQKLRETGPNGIGLFYYAGHGVQVDGENFLLPVGAEIQAEGDVELEAVSAASVLSQMQFAGNAVNLVFLDACRNNPLTRSFRSGSRGLARVDAPRGSFVGYSTAPGDVSVDGESSNSPYALALVEELSTPGISIEEAHRAVRAKVLAATNQRQTPWDSSSLTGPVILKKAVAEEAQVAAVTPPPPTAAGASTQQAELLFWDSIKDSDNPATFEAYLKQFPNGVFAGLAQAKVDELKTESAPADAQSAARQIQPAAPQPEPEPDYLLAPIQPLSGVFVATRSVNIRAGASIEADVVGKLAADQAVDVTGRIGDWLHISANGKTGFVSGKLMAQSDAAEVDAWNALKSAPSEASAKAFLAAHPDGYFRPKADALLAKLQAKKAAPVTQAVEAPAAASQPTAPAATQQAAVMPPPATVAVVRISSALRADVERYLKNSESFGAYYRFLAVNSAGDKIGTSNCRKMTTWISDGCAGMSNPYEGAKRVALQACGRPNECRLIFEGPKKIGAFEIEWY
jgi:uncharacterized caspase-like protein